MVFALSLVWCATVAAPMERWWDGRVEASLDRQPARKAEWVKALEAAPANLRPELAYLVEFLPDPDLADLEPDSLIENARLAREARAAVKWGRTLPEDVYLDAVLPHCSVTEKRDPMRREFKDKYLPLVKDLPTPGAAGLKINEVLFKDFGVTYNTRRLRTDQNSKETIAQGMATCTGLSVMLVEACRAVGVPARVAGIHSWPVRGGNHTWVEIWDNGAWHYVGAAEPDEKGLNHAWFTGDAAKAVKGEPRNAIWAVTYRATGEHFPLAWNPRAKLNGENVTDRYTRPIADSRPRLMVETKQGGTRVEAKVVALDAATGETLLEGTSLGPTADINLHLQAHVEAGKEAFVVARYGAKACSAWVKVEADKV
ncbi:MAG: transglutaminase-like domain-containing protein, partial [Nitrospirae bacterium]|nr:transglutaminase-like domain-containing protein [Fimbriimonadaceae bacterium]